MRIGAGRSCRRAGGALPVCPGIERGVWMVSGKHAFGNDFDVRFACLDADELDRDSDGGCGREHASNAAAGAVNVGLFYTLPAGAALRLTCSEASNKDCAQHDFGLHRGGAKAGGDSSAVAARKRCGRARAALFDGCQRVSDARRNTPKTTVHPLFPTVRPSLSPKRIARR